MKTVADNKLYVTRKRKSPLESLGNIVQKGENARFKIDSSRRQQIVCDKEAESLCESLENIVVKSRKSFYPFTYNVVNRPRTQGH